MFRAALCLQHFEPVESTVDELERIYCSGVSFYKMDQMCAASLVIDVAAISSRWRLTMLSTAQHIQGAYARAERTANQYPRMAVSFPYWRIWLITDECKRSPHAWLDGFAAKWNDEIWKVLHPPFGWDCGCMIQMVCDDSVPLGIEPLQPSLQRLPSDVLRAATGWMAMNPEYLWNRSLLPKRPYVPAERWPTDIARCGPSEEERAILRRYGISVRAMESSS